MTPTATLDAPAEPDHSRDLESATTSPARDQLQHAIDHAAHLLPAQGPITVFIHHNTLHAFEELPFTKGIEKGGRIFGCEPYLGEDRYREALGRGRIRFPDLRDVLGHDLGGHAADPVTRLTTRAELRLVMLQYPLRDGPASELHWFVAETDALRKVRPDASAAARGRLLSESRRWVMRDLRGLPKDNPLAGLFGRYAEGTIETWDAETWEAFTLQVLWRVCQLGTAGVPPFTAPLPLPVRHRDLLVRAGGPDPDVLVHEPLIRLCAAFLDQGFAHWQLPDRDKGFYKAFAALYRRESKFGERWMRGLGRELERLEAAGTDPLGCVLESLAALGVPEAEWDEFLAASFLALRGWGGMVHEVEVRSDRVPLPIPGGSLVEFLAVRLLLDRFALAYTAEEAFGYPVPPERVRTEARKRIAPAGGPGDEARAFKVFQMAQVFGWTPEELYGLPPQEWTTLLHEIEAFHGLERRRVFHLAYECRFRVQTLDALALHPRHVPPANHRPRFQIVTCLDEREESFRRHLEEIAPDVETYGAAGFFAVAMYYRGAADAHFVPLCPIVIRPNHWVTEEVVDTHEQDHRRRAMARKALGTASHRLHAGTRTSTFGAVITGAFGVLASVPLVARILFPRLTAKVRDTFGRVVKAPPATTLRLERKEPEPGMENGRLGYSLDEMIGMGERLLRDIGLIDGFSRLVIFAGHGSGSANNPHRSAYDCGACGGSPGAPNGRALARILNDPRIRMGLRDRGIVIPDDTLFVGGFHNTCNDSVTLYPDTGIPETHAAEFAAAKRDLEATLDRNAHERCRRFMSAPLTLSFPDARRHVEARSEDLAQTRPELGHATNAIAVVGRRSRTRGLFFDRRNFLVSYDPTQDTPEGTVLARTMAAVFPVCGGINLEYYFSHVDSAGFGCGTKLPHNVTAMLGVMDGAASDLRTGLPWQMVEIHEPVRLLIVIETTPAVLNRILDTNPEASRLTRNGWVQVALLDANTNDILLFRDGEYVPYQPQATALPRAKTSTDWYRGWRDHLEFAEIG